MSFNSRTLGRVRPQAGKSQQTEIESFNSRTLGRVRPGDAIRRRYDDSFNSRTLGRVRQYLHDFYPYVLSFNSRTLGRVRRAREVTMLIDGDVSIHAPWEGCDHKPADDTLLGRLFQFTHPGKGAT